MSGTQAMRSLAAFLLALASLLLVLLVSNSAQAEPAFPEESSRLLQDILQTLEFQPRSTPLSLREHFMRAVTPYIKGAGGWIKEQLGKLLQLIERLPAPPSWLNRALLNLWSGLSYLRFIFLAAFSVAAAYLLFRLCCFFKYAWITQRKKQETAPAPTIKRRLSLSQLQAEGRFVLLLLGLRAELRQYFLRHYKLPYSSTDREATELIPPTDRKKSLFQAVSALIEHYLFAEEIPAAVEINTLYKRYQELEVNAP